MKINELIATDDTKFSSKHDYAASTSNFNSLDFRSSSPGYVLQISEIC